MFPFPEIPHLLYHLLLLLPLITSFLILDLYVLLSFISAYDHSFGFLSIIDFHSFSNYNIIGYLISEISIFLPVPNL